MNNYKEKNKINKIIKFTSSLLLASPIAFLTVSCGGEKKVIETPTSLMEKEANDKEPNLWLDEKINEKTTDFYDSFYKSAPEKNEIDSFYDKSNFSWHEGPFKWPNIPGNRVAWWMRDAITKDINSSLYDETAISTKFNFFGNNHSKEVHNFIKNYFDLDPLGNILGFWAGEYEKNENYNEDERVIISSGFGYTSTDWGYLNWPFSLRSNTGITTNVELENGPTFRTKRIYENDRMIIFNRSHFQFNPLNSLTDPFYKYGVIGNQECSFTSYDDFFADHKLKTDRIFENIKGQEGYTKYHDAFNISSRKRLSVSLYRDKNEPVPANGLNWFGSLKVLMGNLELKPSEVFEIASLSFAKIDAIKKELLINKLKAEGIKPFLLGERGDAAGDMLSFVLNPNILTDIEGVYSAGPALNKDIKNSKISDGRIKLSGEMEEINYFSYALEYARMKYGLIDVLEGEIKRSPTFKNDFMNKIKLFIEPKTESRGKAPNNELNFLKENGIKFNYTHQRFYGEDHFSKEFFLKNVMKIEDVNEYLNRKPKWKTKERASYDKNLKTSLIGRDFNNKLYSHFTNTNR